MINPMSQEIRVDQENPHEHYTKNAVSLRHCRSVIGSFNPSDSVDALQVLA